ncbi:hypothetical protein DRQ26_01370 [bacterium]|nr:MAG: hypothetical protein DRQ26_01370 [bacterium]
MFLEKLKHTKINDSNLLKHTFIVSVSLLIANLMNYLFQIYTGRILGPEKYGILGLLLSLFYIFSVPVESLKTFLTTQISKIYSKNRNSIGPLIQKILRKMLFLGIVFMVLLTLFSGMISGIFKIGEILVIYLGVLVILNFIFSIFKFSLAGIQKFKKMSVLVVTSSGIKLLMTVFLISLGFGIFGAIYGIGAGLFLSSVIGIVFLRKFFVYKSSPGVKDSKSYFYYTFFTVLLITLFYSIDIILVKLFFSPEQVGYYVAASTAGKITFFLCGPVVLSMLPKASAIEEKKKNPKHLLYYSILYTLVLGGFATLVFLIAPAFVVKTLYGTAYAYVKNLVGIFSVGMLFLSLTNVAVQYNLATKGSSHLLLLFLGIFLEISGIVLFHSTLVEVVKVFVISTGLVASTVVLRECL